MFSYYFWTSWRAVHTTTTMVVGGCSLLWFHFEGIGRYEGHWLQPQPQLTPTPTWPTTRHCWGWLKGCLHHEGLLLRLTTTLNHIDAFYHSHLEFANGCCCGWWWGWTSNCNLSLVYSLDLRRNKSENNPCWPWITMLRCCLNFLPKPWPWSSLMVPH